MKECPKCNMTVNAHCECPACKNNITDIPYSERKWERYTLNRYLLPYLIKKRLFCIVCVLVLIIRLITNHSIDSWYFFVLSIVSVTACFLYTFFENGMLELDLWKYSEAYIEPRHKILKWSTGVISIVLSFLW